MLYPETQNWFAALTPDCSSAFSGSITDGATYAMTNQSQRDVARQRLRWLLLKEEEGDAVYFSGVWATLIPFCRSAETTRDAHKASD